MTSTRLPLLEFILLCIVMPTVIWSFNLGSMMFNFLWGATLYCLAMLVFLARQQAEKPWQNWREAVLREWNWGAVTWANLKPVLARWIAASLFIAVFVYFYEPERLFYLPLERPQIIPFLVVAYPLLSALPQEFIFCSFFMKRYTRFFKSDRVKIVASAVVFGYAHMLFINWIAPVFSFLGGLIFASTYLKTRSLALVTIEHSLYGNSIFLIGLGQYFYSGGIGQ